MLKIYLCIQCRTAKDNSLDLALPLVSNLCIPDALEVSTSKKRSFQQVVAAPEFQDDFEPNKIIVEMPYFSDTIFNNPTIRMVMTFLVFYFLKVIPIKIQNHFPTKQQNEPLKKRFKDPAITLKDFISPELKGVAICDR